jgi:ParB-like nuclease domain
MATSDTLLAYGDVTNRLRIRSQRYDGVGPIPLEKVIGSVDRSTGDFDRHFRPLRREVRERVRRMRDAFARDQLPPIEAFEIGGLYFVVDGHHRVAAAREAGAEFIDSQVTSVRTSHRLTPDVDVLQLIHTEQHRIFKERTRLLERHPEAKIEFSRPTWYGELLDIVRAHAYRLSDQRGDLVPMAEATADWYENEFLPALEAARTAELPDYYRHKTDGDLFLWVHAKRRDLRMTNRDATWADAARAARHEGVPHGEQRALRRERRRPLPVDSP